MVTVHTHTRTGREKGSFADHLPVLLCIEWHHAHLTRSVPMFVLSSQAEVCLHLALVYTIRCFFCPNYLVSLVSSGFLPETKSVRLSVVWTLEAKTKAWFGILACLRDLSFDWTIQEEALHALKLMLDTRCCKVQGFFPSETSRCNISQSGTLSKAFASGPNESMSTNQSRTCQTF